MQNILMNLIKKTISISIIWLLSLIFVLIFFEIALRVIYSDDKTKLSIDTISELSLLVNFEHNYDIANLYPSEERTVKYSRDKYGIRNSCGNPKNINILAIGGSTTDERFVANESTYVGVLEKLVSDYTGKEICVANAGIDGHSTYGHIRAFETWFPALPNLKPQYILLYVGINDSNFEKKTREERPIKSFVRKTYLSKKSRPFFNYIKGKAESFDNSNIGHRNLNYKLSDYTVTHLADNTVAKAEKNAIAFRKRFKKIIAYVEEMGAKPICVTQPHIYTRVIDGKKHGLPKILYGYGGLDYDYSIQQINKVMREFCGNNLIDIYSVEFKEGSFYDGVHTTDIGSEFIGKKMFEAMKQKGMLEVF